MKTFKTFYVLWTFYGNYSRLLPVRAKTAEDAKTISVGYFRDEFHEKATVFVFDKPPTLIACKGSNFSGRKRVERYLEASKEDAS